MGHRGNGLQLVIGGGSSVRGAMCGNKLVMGGGDVVTVAISSQWSAAVSGQHWMVDGDGRSWVAVGSGACGFEPQQLAVSSQCQMVADGRWQVAVCGGGCGFELRWQPCCDVAVAYVNGA